MAAACGPRARTLMKLERSSLDGNVVTGAGAGWVGVRGIVHRESLLLTADGTTRPWPPRSWAELSERHFLPVAALDPEIVLLGSGAVFRLPAPGVIRPLIDAGIGFESMTTQAACRTFNILAAEGRRVAAALIVEDDAATAPR